MWLGYGGGTRRRINLLFLWYVRIDRMVLVKIFCLWYSLTLRSSLGFGWCWTYSILLGHLKSWQFISRHFMLSRLQPSRLLCYSACMCADGDYAVAIDGERIWKKLICYWCYSMLDRSSPRNVQTAVLWECDICKFCVKYDIDAGIRAPCLTLLYKVPCKPEAASVRGMNIYLLAISHMSPARTGIYPITMYSTYIYIPLIYRHVPAYPQRNKKSSHHETVSLIQQPQTPVNANAARWMTKR